MPFQMALQLQQFDLERLELTLASVALAEASNLLSFTPHLSLELGQALNRPIDGLGRR